MAMLHSIFHCPPLQSSHFRESFWYPFFQIVSIVISRKGFWNMALKDSNWLCYMYNSSFTFELKFFILFHILTYLQHRIQLSVPNHVITMSVGFVFILSLTKAVFFKLSNHESSGKYARGLLSWHFSTPKYPKQIIISSSYFGPFLCWIFMFNISRKNYLSIKVADFCELSTSSMLDGRADGVEECLLSSFNRKKWLPTMCA